MEKMILIRGSGLSEANGYLESGWTVKLLKTVNDDTTSRFYAYAVLEKPDEEPRTSEKFQ